MEKLSIMDVLSLARAGYKKKEIDEIMAAGNVPDEAPATTPKESERPEAQKEPAKEPVTKPNEPDYKVLFEEMQKKNEDLSSKLEAAQKANITSDVSTNQTKISTSETINNIFKDVLS